MHSLSVAHSREKNNVARCSAMVLELICVKGKSMRDMKAEAKDAAIKLLAWYGAGMLIFQLLQRLAT